MSDEIDKILAERREIRRIERKLRKEWKRSHTMSANMPLGAVEGDVATLKQNLAQVIPPYMMPGNVGGYNKVTWPFWFQVNFDFGTNPTWSSAIRSTQSFQVTQEAAFLLMAISRKSYGYSTASELSPTQVEIRDRQSSRQFNDRPIPYQMIGKKSRPSVLPTPLLVMPNAFIDVTMSSWLPNGVSQATVGTGKFQLSFFGYRIRVEDADKVMSTIFG
jgi:hypothetical protein